MIMADKIRIIEELGESELLLPGIVNKALAANDRIKYYFTLLQTARNRADHPRQEIFSLKVEREDAGETDILLDGVVAGTVKSAGIYRVPYLRKILSSVQSCMHDMVYPFEVQHTDDGKEFRKRVDALLEQFPQGDGDIISGEIINAITSGDISTGDSLHLLVMDLHKLLNRLQADLSRESISGAMTYSLRPEDRPPVQSFMDGLHRTEPLKFGHPGLGTTATRINDRVVIQNNIGLTDAHVLVVKVEGTVVTVTYTDIHMQRLQFFQSLFEKWSMKWEDTLSRKGPKTFEKKMYHLSSGRYTGKDEKDRDEFLSYLGSRIVFLIDWNRARKSLRNFLPNKDTISVLKWAADNDAGHLGYLSLGGEVTIYEALDLAAKAPLRYGEPLHRILGREKTTEYFIWVLRTASNGLIREQSVALIKDEIRAEMLRFFRSAHEGLRGLSEEHATYLVEVAEVVRDSLIHASRGKETDFITRSARRAKRWESQADAIVSKIRTLSQRMEKEEYFIGLITASDDALDSLEEAAFFITLTAPHKGARPVIQRLTGLAELALRGSQELLKAIIASQYVQQGFTREEMQEFLTAVDRVVGIEREADEELRTTVTTVLTTTTDPRELAVFMEIARNIEESTNALMKAGFIMRDTILAGVNR
jgi:uncharacterized protein Yka (UPF0111/DUF47 family)